MECIREKGPFEFYQWGSIVRIEYREKDNDYPFQVLIDGAPQSNKRYLDLLRFVFDNRKDINRKVRKLQGKKQYLSHKYLNIDRLTFEEMYKEAYKNHLKHPEQSVTGVYMGVQEVALKMLPFKELEELKEEAMREYQAEKIGKKEAKEVMGNSNN